MAVIRCVLQSSRVVMTEQYGESDEAHLPGYIPDRKPVWVSERESIGQSAGQIKEGMMRC